MKRELIRNKSFVKKTCAFMMLILGILPASPAFSLSLDELIGTSLSGALYSGEKPVSAQFKDIKPQLVPRHGVLLQLMEAVRQDLNPGVMVETLHLYKKPPSAEKTAWSAREEIELFNSILALSTLSGLEYYSASRGTMRTFYETSYVVDGPSTKKVLEDPVYSRLPGELTVFAQQKDLSFGNNIYQYDYFTAPGALIFIQQNNSSLTYGIVPAVGKNKLRSIVAILDAGEYILVYAASMAKAASLPGMKERIGESFSNRAIAVLNWFSNQADEAYRKASL